MPRPRLPIHLTEFPMKVIEAVAPAVLDCTAEPPLHPQLESLRVHAPLKVTAVSVSSTRIPAVGNVGAVLGPGPGEPVVLPPPPPPHETSRPARNKIRTRVM
jgi:hypothetical protein